ncbi:MAG: zinc-dependent alcohol dehydrogenase family protein [Elusimicrobiota bacterium]
MKAWALSRQAPIERDPLRLKDIPKPKPGKGQVLLRVLCCGVCHTDLHIVEGDIPLKRRPTIPGHQIVGLDEASGRRVGVPWLHTTCGKCADCKAGRENLCTRAKFTGYHVPGGFAEYAAVDKKAAYPLPGNYSDVEAAPLLCAGVIGYRALRLSGSGKRLGLYGFGASAHLTLQMARHVGCRVYVFSRTPDHRSLARKLGAAWTGRAEDKPPRPLDGGIIFAPAGGLVPLALSHLKAGGTLALAGITMTPLPAMPYSLIYGERRLLSVANSTRQDVLDFLRLAGGRKLRIQTEVFPMSEAPSVLRRLKQGEVHGAAVLTPGWTT